MLQRKGWFRRRTGLEKALLAVLGVGVAAVMMAGLVVFRHGSPSEELNTRTEQGQDDICTTADCALAGGRRVYENSIVDIVVLQFVFPAAEIIQGMDITADPCEDFYRFACGGWMDSNAIPDGKNKWGRFYELRGAVDKALKGGKL